jgi:hypothetical protein
MESIQASMCWQAKPGIRDPVKAGRSLSRLLVVLLKFMENHSRVRETAFYFLPIGWVPIFDSLMLSWPTQLLCRAIRIASHDLAD